jgi:serine/threonine protein kinase
VQQGLGKDFRNSERLDAGTWIAGQFQIIDLIGVGGMGAVYKCMDRMTNRLVAAKVLRRDLAVDSKAVQRFQREAQAIAALEHQNIVKLYNFQSDGEAPMLIMEYVEGSPLNKLLEEQGSLKLTRALDIASQICDALNYAHKAGIIHRDLKPSNIIIKKNSDGSETAKLVDFGIAKVNDAHSSMTATGEIFGSPGYMSPEQSTGQMVSESADQYSLGCVLFECLTGSRPFISDTPLAVVMQHVKDPPPTLKEASLGNHFPAALENIVQRMLEKDPARRFASMLAVRDALSGKRIEAAASPSKSGKAGEKSNRTISNALIGAGIILPIVALSGIGWFLFRE